VKKLSGPSRPLVRFARGYGLGRSGSVRKELRFRKDRPVHEEVDSKGAARFGRGFGLGRTGSVPERDLGRNGPALRRLRPPKAGSARKRLLRMGRLDPEGASAPEGTDPI
jgi:hypothetical protein